MLIQAEDRAVAGASFAKVGGRLIGYYLTFGEYDFLSIARSAERKPDGRGAARGVSSGGVTDLKNHAGHDLDRGQGRLCRGQRLAPGYKGAARLKTLASKTNKRRPRDLISV